MELRTWASWSLVEPAHSHAFWAGSSSAMTSLPLGPEATECKEGDRRMRTAAATFEKRRSAGGGRQAIGHALTAKRTKTRYSSHGTPAPIILSEGSRPGLAAGRGPLNSQARSKVEPK